MGDPDRVCVTTPVRSIPNVADWIRAQEVLHAAATTGAPCHSRGMPVDVTTTIEIDRSRTDVAGYATDPTNATAWYRNIKSVEWKTQKPLALGSGLPTSVDATDGLQRSLKLHSPARRLGLFNSSTSN